MAGKCIGLAASQFDETAGEYTSLSRGLLSCVLTQEGLVQQKADWNPKDQRITVGEWLSDAAEAVPRFQKETPASSGEKGIVVEREPNQQTKALLVPLQSLTFQKKTHLFYRNIRGCITFAASFLNGRPGYRTKRELEKAIGEARPEKQDVY